MKGLLKYVALCIVAATVAVVATLTLHWLNVPTSAVVDDIKYTDFLSITLTALGLMITVLGLFLAVAGVVGWATMESKLKAHSVEYFAVQLAKDGPLRRDLEQLFAEIAYAGIEGLKEPPAEDSPYND